MNRARKITSPRNCRLKCENNTKRADSKTGIRSLPYGLKKAPSFQMELFVLALPIFTARHQATIVGANELNFCVRDGNRWTLTAINTNSYGWGCFPIVYVKVPSDSNRFFAKQRFAT